MKISSGTVLSLALMATLCLPSSAQFSVRDRQQWSAVSTSILPINAPERSTIDGVSNTSSFLSFGTTATVNEIGSNQVVWGSDSELTNGDVVATFCGDVPTKMFWSFSSAVCGFGFEVMNNDLHEPQDFVVSYYNGATLLGTMQQTSDNTAFWKNYDYFAGDVRLFAAEDIRGITGVDIVFSSNSMSAAAFRVSNCSPDVVPEPSGIVASITLLATVATLVLCTRHRRRCPTRL
ncbi:MAG: hypothetical protein ACKO14_06545 [Armatimonadota bacterium]